MKKIKKWFEQNRFSIFFGLMLYMVILILLLAL